MSAMFGKRVRPRSGRGASRKRRQLSGTLQVEPLEPRLVLTCASPDFTEHSIATNFDGARSISSIDIDGDSDMDVLAASFWDDEIAWWENDGSQNFTKRTIDGDFDEPRTVIANDLDQDGDIDILGAATLGNDITWWENDGSENFTEHTIDGDFNGAYGVFVIDLDGDGDRDVLGAASESDEIAWWENDGSEGFTKHTIDGNFEFARHVTAVDVDGDSDIDVLGVAAGADDVTWWENDGSENFTEHTIDGDYDNAHGLAVADLDGDGDVDVLGTSIGASDVTWWENNNDTPGTFTKHTIKGDFSVPISVVAADLDDDGDLDVLATGQGGTQALFWFENDGSENFTAQQITTSYNNAHGLFAVEFDGDGDIDFLTTSGGADEITWWETTCPDPDPPVLNSFALSNPASSPTAADTLVFLATFNEDVQNVSTADFTVNGATTATVTGVTMTSASTYEITVSGGDLAGFNGTVGLNLAGGQDITDLAGNALPAGEPATDQTYMVDNAPVLESFTRSNPTGTPTAADTLVFLATFNEGVQNVSTGDFTVSGATTATVASVNSTSATTYEITVSGGDLASFNGVVGLNLAGGQDITDTDGTATALPAGEPATDETYTVDNDAPGITSFTRSNPAGSPTAADTLVFLVTFDEDVQNVTTADFTANGTTATVTNVNSTSASTYEVTVSGGDLADLNGTVGLDLAGGQDITDVVGNALPAGEPATDETYVLDNAPILLSFTRSNPATSPTNADTLVFLATFNEDVQNVTTGDFTVNGGTTATVTGINSTSASTYEVTVSGGDLASFTGTVGLNLAGGQDITDTDGTATALPAGEPATDETYVLDNDPPGITSFTRSNPASEVTGADTLVFLATFDEGVQNVTTADFTVTGTTATVTGINATSTTTYEVTVSGGDLAGLNGSVGLNLAGGQDITDLVGNALPAGEPATDQTYTVDNGPPALTSFTRSNPAGSPTASDTLVFLATFDEDVQNVTTADFSVNGTTTATVTNVNSTSASTYEVTVSGGDLANFNGTVGLNLVPTQDITDTSGNALPPGEPATDETYTVDNAPVLESFTRSNPATNLTSADSLVFLATFNEDVQNVDTADFTVNGTTTATVTGINSTSASTYEVTVSGGDLAGFNGTVGLNLAGGQNITDIDGTADALPAGEPATDETYTVENDTPGITSFARSNPATTPTAADTLVFLVTFDEDVQNVSTGDFSASGTTTATVTSVNSTSASTYEVTISGGDLASFNGVVGLDLSGSQNIADIAGNALPAGEPSTDETYLLDNNAPSLTSFTRDTPAGSPTAADSLVFLATFDEDVQNVDAADFTVDGTTTATVTNVNSTSASTYEVTVSGGDLANFNGVVGLNLAGGHNIADTSGNTVPVSEPSTDETYLVDNIPILQSFTRSNPTESSTNANTLVFLATFNEGVQNVSTGDFSVNGTTTATVTGINATSTSTYEVTVSGGDLSGFNGTVGLNLAGGQNITDTDGTADALPAGEPATDETYLLDNNTPGLTSFTRSNPAGSPTAADTLVFLATFDEDVQNVTTADFRATGTTATVTGINATSASTYEVTVSGGDLANFNGTVGLNLQGGQDIQDLAGNALPAGEPTTDESYTVDNAPVLESFARSNPASSPTDADTLVFLATFNEDVQNVTTGDFSVNGTTTATVTGVNSTSARTYEITISGGDLANFNGAVGLNLAGGQDITDTDGTATALPAGEPATDESYLVDNDDPVLESFARSNPANSPTNADALIFLVTFDEDVQNVSTTDFSVNGTTTATVTSVSATSASTYEVTVSGGDLAGFNGTVGLDLAGGQNITDLVGHALPSGEPATDETYTVDNDAPALTSFTRNTPAGSPTTADTLVFLATFDGDVQNVDTADFTINGTTTATVTNVNSTSASTYEVTVSGGDLANFNGAVGLDLAGGHNISDQAGNTVPSGEPATDETYTVDNIPILESFARDNPASSPTTADTLVFLATFNEDVQNVTTDDFTVNGSTTATVTGINSTSASTYEVTVSGGDLASFNGTVGLDLAGGQNITDMDGAADALPAGEPATDETYTVDNDAPGITSFARSNPAGSPTTADTLVFLVTFDEDVQNVDTADFTVDGTTTATVTNVNSTSASTYEVTISGGDLVNFNGAVGLDLAGGQNITDTAGNALPAGEPATDETYTVDNVPVLESFARSNPASSPTNADSLIFLVTFNEDVQNVDTADFTVDGTTTATVTTVNSMSASTYEVTISGGNLAGFNGVVGLNLAGGQNITDTDGTADALPAGEPATDETYTVDNDVPGLTSFARSNPASNPTAADSLVFLATFDEDVQNVDTADFIVNGATTATVTNVNSTSASTYEITVSGGDLASFNGAVGVDLAGGQNITDLVGLALPTFEPATDETYTVDNDAPGITSFTRSNPASSPTAADSLVFLVTFDEDVQNVTTGDFSVSGATTATVTNVNSTSASTYEVTISGGDLVNFNGTVGLDLAGGQDVTDTAGNALPAGEPVTDETYTVDNAPVLESFTRSNPASSPTNADTLVFLATFNEDVQNVTTGDFTISGTTTATVTGINSTSASTYEVTVSGGDLASFSGTVGLDLAGGQDITDTDGIPTALPTGEPATDETYTVENDPPGITSFVRSNPAGNLTNADSLVFLVTFDEGVQNVGTADFTVNGTTTATVTDVNSTSTSTYEVTVSGGDLAGFNGTVGLDLAGGQDITDLVGNALPAGEPATDETYTVDNDAPGITSFTRSNPASSPTAADSLIFLVTFDEDVQNVTTGDFSVSGATTATVTNVNSTSASTYEVTISGGDLVNFNGTVGLDLAGGQDVTDTAGNALPAGEPATDETYTVDNAPVLESFTLSNPASSPTNADTLVFLATFNEDVQNVTIGDFTVSGTTTATVTGINSTSASTYEVTVSGGDLASFNGAVGLDLAGGQDITDLDGAADALPAGEPATDATYTVDNNAPGITSFTRSNPSTSSTAADTLVFLATFDEGVQNVSTGDFAVTGTTATVTAVTSTSASTYEVTVSGGDLADLNGTVGLDLAGGQNITDIAGNALPAGEPATDETYTLDNAPVLESFTRSNPATSPTGADTLVFLATFNEGVQNVGTADFSVNGTTTATVTGVNSTSASTYEVTVSGGDLADFNGVVGLDLAAAQDITDTDGAAHALPVGEPATDETYTVENLAPPALLVSGLQASESTVGIEFESPIEPGALQLYSSAATGGQTADVTLTGETTGLVQGSLVWDAGQEEAVFVKTGGPLPPDTYTLRILDRSTDASAGAFAKLALLGDGLASGDFVQQFTVLPTTGPTVSVPDFVRGPRQSVDLENSGGLPIQIDDAANVQRFEAILRYDPALLDVNGVRLSADVPGDWTLTTNTSTPGELGIVAHGPTAMTVGPATLVLVDAEVDASAAYGASALIQFDFVSLNDGGISASVDDGVQVVSYLGDVTGNGDYSALDAAFVARVAVGLDAGFGDYPTIDPLLLADVTGDSTISALDAAFVARKAVGLDQEEIPDLPDTVPALPATEAAAPVVTAALGASSVLAHSSSAPVPTVSESEPAADLATQLVGAWESTGATSETQPAVTERLTASQSSQRANLDDEPQVGRHLLQELASQPPAAQTDAPASLHDRVLSDESGWDDHEDELYDLLVSDRLL